jgi:hypothetical protein
MAVTLSGSVKVPIRTTVYVIINDTGVVHEASPSPMGYYEVQDIPKGASAWVWASSLMCTYTPTIYLVYLGEDDVTNINFLLSNPGSFTFDTNVLDPKIPPLISLDVNTNAPAFSAPHVRPKYRAMPELPPRRDGKL